MQGHDSRPAIHSARQCFFWEGCCFIAIVIGGEGRGGGVGGGRADIAALDVVLRSAWLLVDPLAYGAFLITGKTEWVVYANGHFDGRAAIAGVLLLMYLPVACLWASRASGCFGKLGGR